MKKKPKLNKKEKLSKAIRKIAKEATRNRTH